MPDTERGEVDAARSGGFAELLRAEDYWAIWLGFALLGLGLLVFLPRAPEGAAARHANANAALAREAERAPFKTVTWHLASDAKAKLTAKSEPFAKSLATWIAKPSSWQSNPLESLVRGESATLAKRGDPAQVSELADRVGEAERAARDAEALAAAAGFEDTAINARAEAAVTKWRSAKRALSKAKKKAEAKPYNRLVTLPVIGLAFILLLGGASRAMGRSFSRFAVGFVLVFGLAVLAYVAAAQVDVNAIGIGYAAWAIALGLLVSNTVGTPKWVEPAVQTELFIKTGLVLLGAEVLFGKVLTIGLPGIFVAWVVTPVVLVSTYWFGQRVLRMTSKTLNITICADMSVCGVSAAIATAAACRAKKEELTLAVGLSLVFTSIMMVVMPATIQAMGIDPILGGAWIGGTIDATGAVAAAGAFLGDRALHVAATIKMIQNVLIGVIAFGVAIYFTTRVEGGGTGDGADSEAGADAGANAPRKVTAMEIWYRFPKFVIGFVVASIAFSSIYAALGPDLGYTLIDHGVIRGFSKTMRGWLFCLAFVSIGLATNFRTLSHHFKGGKPLVLYVTGQTLNLTLTFVMAYLMFRVVFPELGAKI